MTFGATPLIGQAFGAGNHARCGIVLMRVLAVHVVVMLLLSGPLTGVAGPLLRAVGQPAVIADNAQLFILVRYAGLPSVIVATDLTAYLNAQRCPRLPMMVNLVNSVGQVGLMLGLTRTLGFVGAPLGMTLAETAQATMLFVLTPWYLRRKRVRSWPRWRRDARQAVRGWREILILGAPAACMIMSEWGGALHTLMLSRCPPHAAPAQRELPAARAHAHRGRRLTQRSAYRLSAPQGGRRRSLCRAGCAANRSPSSRREPRRGRRVATGRRRRATGRLRTALATQQ